ncbi:MAG: hypothetical protein ACREEM_02115 [Blastocatellia bacterium]
MTGLSDAEKAKFIAAMREEILRDDELIERLGEKIQKRREKSSLLARPFEAMAARQIEKFRRESDDEEPVSKWGVSLFAGVIGMACASDPGGLNEGQGFAFGFVVTFLGVIFLEVIAKRNRAGT